MRVSLSCVSFESTWPLVSPSKTGLKVRDASRSGIFSSGVHDMSYSSLYEPRWPCGGCPLHSAGDSMEKNFSHCSSSPGPATFFLYKWYVAPGRRWKLHLAWARSMSCFAFSRTVRASSCSCLICLEIKSNFPDAMALVCESAV